MIPHFYPLSYDKQLSFHQVPFNIAIAYPKMPHEHNSKQISTSYHHHESHIYFFYKSPYNSNQAYHKAYP